MLALAFAGADAAGATSETFQDWALTCDADRNCRLAQTLMSQERIWIATIMLHPYQDDEKGRMVEMFVPPGVHFPSGLFVAAAPDAHQQAEWLRCTEAACEASARLDAAAEAQWRRGVTAELRYRPSPTAPVVLADISLMGVTAGLAALDARADDARTRDAQADEARQ